MHTQFSEGGKEGRRLRRKGGTHVVHAACGVVVAGQVQVLQEAKDNRAAWVQE
jgi:hypothetical protein